MLWPELAAAPTAASALRLEGFAFRYMVSGFESGSFATALQI